MFALGLAPPAVIMSDHRKPAAGAVYFYLYSILT